MTRGGDKDIEGWPPKFLDTPKREALKTLMGYEGGGGGSENMYTSKRTGGGGATKKIEPLVRGAAKISSFEFRYLHPPPPLSPKLSLKSHLHRNIDVGYPNIFYNLN